MKVRIFVRNKTSELESAINDWLAENPEIEIKTICQSEAKTHSTYNTPGKTQTTIYSNLTISVWYKALHRQK